MLSAVIGWFTALGALAAEAPADPFAAFPTQEGEQSLPQIEAWRDSLRPEAFKPAHEVVITDALFFRYKKFKDYVRACGGKPSDLTLLPKANTPATLFRATYENPQAPIRSYVGYGYACVMPGKIGPLALGPDRATAHGLITFSDGSYWLGEVTGAAHPQSRGSLLGAVSTPLVPTPAGVGEWGRPDGTRLQGTARAVPVAVWPNKSWTAATTMVGFEMVKVERALLPGGARPAGDLKLVDGSVVAAQPLPPTLAAAEASASAAAPAALSAPTAVALPAPAAANTAMGSVAPPVGGEAAAIAVRIERWRSAMQSTDFAAARSSVATAGLSKARDYSRHVQQCAGGGQPTPFRLTFGDGSAQIREFTGYLPGCVFPSESSEAIFGLIRYADGSTWLGQVTSMPQAEAIELGAFGGMPAPVHTLVPAPNGLGEWTWSSGTRVQGTAALMQAKVMFRSSWLQGPLGAFAMSAVSQVISSDGVAYTGDLRLGEDGIYADSAMARWPDGRVFAGSIAKGLPASGKMSFADGAWIAGTVVAGDNGVPQWEAGMDLALVAESEAGPPGRYRHSVRLPFNLPTLASLPLRGARPMDAATLARSTRNNRQCARPSVVPAGWVVWWPSCEPGGAGSVALYSPDASQELTQYASSEPARFVLRKGQAPGQLLGIEILGSAFDANPNPSPVGEGELRLWGEGTVFIGNFQGQAPGTGQCPVPSEEGGGWEPCQLVAYQRVDAMHQLRQQRLALQREQEEMESRLASERRDAEINAEEAYAAEQRRRDKAAGDAAIAQALMGAMRDIGAAYVDREAARNAADLREREAARPVYTPPPPSGGYSSSPDQGANSRAAQLAAQQAELARRQEALRVQQQTLAATGRSSQASASALPSQSSAGSAAQAELLSIHDHSVGRQSGTTQFQGLSVTTEINRVGLRISGADRSEICAVFENRSGSDWSGGYRLTDRNDNSTHASMRIPAGSTARKCETLNPQSGYTVVLRRAGG